jgi:hypothetical protein
MQSAMQLNQKGWAEGSGLQDAKLMGETRGVPGGGTFYSHPVKQPEAGSTLKRFQPGPRELRPAPRLTFFLTRRKESK